MKAIRAAMRASVSLMAGLLFSGSPADAQQCTFDWTPHYEKLTRLTDDLPASGDARSVATWLSLSGSSNNLRETWYFPRATASGTGPLYRVLNSGTGDRRDAPDLSAPGYTQDLILGYPWTERSRPGLTPLRRYINLTTGDYRTWLFSQTPSGYTQNATWWATGATPRLGYERFGTVLPYPNVLATAYDTYVLENFHLKVEMNKIWGNAIGRLTHKPSGRQIVREPIGEMVQSVVRFTSGPTCSEGGLANPTQSGGVDCADYGETRNWAGSPLISASITGSDPYLLTSEIRPLEFCSQGTDPSARWPNVDGASPLAWHGVIERTETLGCMLGQTKRRDILKTASRYRLLNSHGLSSQSLSHNNTHWLDIESWGSALNEDFTLEWVNLSTGQTEVIDYTDSSGHVLWDAPPFEKINVNYPLAVKVTRADGLFAIAIARLDSSSVSNDVTRVKLRCPEPFRPNCIGQQALIVQVVRQGQLTTTSYGNPLESFLIVNTSNDVDDRLALLPGDGGNCLQ